MKFLPIVRTVVAYGSVFYCLTEYGIEAVMCQGPSMTPTIEHNSVLIAEHVSVIMKNIQKDDIVICLNPNQPTRFVCKRVTALEGESVRRNQMVPRGHIWLEGDNRFNSLDSRTFGPVPYGLVRSRVILKIWPLTDIRWLSSHWFYARESESV